MGAYPDPFESYFMQRTLEILSEYGGKYDATLLINCLLGLLVLPKEAFFNKIPEDPLSSLPDWGISEDAIKKFGKCQCGDNYPKTIQQFVRCLRNAAAHFDIKPLHENRNVVGFNFKDRSKFSVELSIGQIKDFVEKLARYLKEKFSAK